MKLELRDEPFDFFFLGRGGVEDEARPFLKAFDALVNCFSSMCMHFSLCRGPFFNSLNVREFQNHCF